MFKSKKSYTNRWIPQNNYLSEDVKNFAEDMIARDYEVS